MTPREQLDRGGPIFAEILKGNLLPICWLFGIQQCLGVQWHGIGFWTLYGLYSVVLIFLMWVGNRSVPDPSYKTQNEIPTPILGITACVFQVLIYFGTMGVYFMT
jgi:hypothetical protein